jgi:hypothetical protein
VPEERPPPAVERLSLTREEQWTLHAVLRDRRGRADEEAEGGPSGSTKERAGATGHRRAAFERLDGGEQRFTRAELRAIQQALARAHHTRRWEVERPQLEGILHQVSVALDRD